MTKVVPRTPATPLGVRRAIVAMTSVTHVSERDIMRQTGHKSTEMLAKYIRVGEIFMRNTAAGLGI